MKRTFEELCVHRKCILGLPILYDDILREITDRIMDRSFIFAITPRRWGKFGVRIHE